MSCVILGCTSHTSRKEFGAEILSFHRFPNDIIVRQKWIDAIAHSNWQWKTHHVCSRHFSMKSFINFEHKWRRLKSDAIPTMHLKIKKKISRTPSLSPNIPSTSRLRPWLSFEHTQLIRYVAKLEQQLEKLKKVSQIRLLKINALQQKNKHLNKKNIDIHTKSMNVLYKERNGIAHLIIEDK